MLAFFPLLLFFPKPPSTPWNQHGNCRFFVRFVTKFVVIPGGGGGLKKKNEKWEKTRALIFDIYFNHHGTKGQRREICTV